MVLGKVTASWRLVLRNFEPQAENVDFCGRQWGATEGCIGMGENGLMTASQIGVRGRH